MSLLSVENLTITFGGLTAVSDVNMQIGDHQLIGLIGPNGAGKTTLFNMLTGVYKPTHGKIEVNGERIDGTKPYDITSKRISRTFQNIRLFQELTVLENVMISFNFQAKASLFEFYYSYTCSDFRGRKNETRSVRYIEDFQLR